MRTTTAFQKPPPFTRVSPPSPQLGLLEKELASATTSGARERIEKEMGKINAVLAKLDKKKSKDV